MWPPRQQGGSARGLAPSAYLWMKMLDAEAAFSLLPVNRIAAVPVRSVPPLKWDVIEKV